MPTLHMGDKSMNYSRVATYWRVFLQYRKMWMMHLFTYRIDFFFWGFVSLMWTVFNLLFMEILIGISGNIGGWNRGQLYVLMGTFSILDAFTWSFLYNLFRQYTWQIFSGEFDFVLIKPVSTQFLVSVQRNSYNNIFRLILGIAIVMNGLSQLSFHPGVLDVLAYIGLMCVGMIMIYSLWFMISTVAFYVERLDNINEIFPALRQVFQVPRTVYTGFFSTLFTVVLPLGLISSLPTEMLLGRFSGNLVLYFVMSTMFFFVLARIFFVHSVKKYAGAGS